MTAVASAAPSAHVAQTVEFVRGCLQQGYTQAEIAASLGMAESYISQLCTAHNLNAAQPRFADIDALYEELEKKALEQLRRVMGTVSDPMKLTRIASSMNASKRRSIAPAVVTEGSGTLVQLQLPQAMAAQFIFNASGEAVAYQSEGATRPLVTVTADQLASMAAARAATPLEVKHEHAASGLPADSEM